MRPLRGGQGTFDRIIENIRQVAGTLPDRHRRQLRRDARSTAIRRCSSSCRSRTSRDKLVKVNFKPIVRDRSRRRPKGILPLTPVGAASEAAERHLHDVGRRGRRRRPATPATSLDDKMTFLREETQAARLPDARRRAQRPVPRAHARTRTRSAPTGRSTRAPGSPASWRCRPATSTTGATRGAKRRARSSTDSTRGRSAGTARSSRCVPGDASWHRIHQLGDMNMPTCHKRELRIGAHLAGA